MYQIPVSILKNRRIREAICWSDKKLSALLGDRTHITLPEILDDERIPKKDREYASWILISAGSDSSSYYDAGLDAKSMIADLEERHVRDRRIFDPTVTILIGTKTLDYDEQRELADLYARSRPRKRLRILREAWGIE